LIIFDIFLFGIFSIFAVYILLKIFLLNIKGGIQVDTICELISKAKNGDNDSMMNILTMFTGLIKKYAYKLDYEDAENDLIVSVIQLIYDMPELINDGQAVSYIKHSVYNFYNKYVKIQIMQREHMVPYDPEIIHNISELSDTINEDNIALYYAVEKLKPNYRQIIIYKFFRDMTDNEIMKIMNLSRQSVYINKIKAIKMLKELLKDDF